MSLQLILTIFYTTTEGIYIDIFVLFLEHFKSEIISE